jgi:hypothetical protein
MQSPRDKTLLIQCSTDDVNVQVPQTINWNDVQLPSEWLLQNEMPVSKIQ